MVGIVIRIESSMDEFRVVREWKAAEPEEEE